MSGVLQDIAYAIRRLTKNPGFTALAVLTLALGVGGTSATYGVARLVLFEPLPYSHAREVGVFWKKTDWTEEEFLHIRGRVPGFRQVALYRQRDVILREGGRPARLVPGVTSSAELFDVLGAAPLLGRGFRAGDDVTGAEAVAILSYGLWQEFGGNPSIIGTPVTVNGAPRTVIGVMPRAFWFPDPSVRIWMPVPLSADSRSWNSTLIGRVVPGQDVRGMEGPLTQLMAMLDERFDYPAQWDKTRNGYITSLQDDFTGTMRPALLAALGAMTLLLLIACANVSALVLGQVAARSVEFAVRSALGASRHRLIQSLVIEVLLIAVAAGLIGSVVAWSSFNVVSHALPLGAWAESAAPDGRVFASAMLMGIAGALVVMLVPTLSLHRGDLRGAMNRVRTTAVLEGRGGRLESGLVIAQVALAVMVAAGAALLARSVANLYGVNPGVRTDGVAVVDVVLGTQLSRARLEQTLNELTAALAELPGVRSVGTTQTLPLRGGGYNVTIGVEGRPDLEGLTTEYRIVSAGYLESVGIALRRGRTISAADRRDAERVVVINETLAGKFFPGVDPIGKLLGGDVGRRPSRVIGVVANAVERRLTDPDEPVRYVALTQMPWIDDAQSLILRSAPGIDETTLLERARRTIARVAPGVAVQQTTTMRRVLDTAIGPARQVVLLLSLMTVFALTLGGIGVYGVITHFVARRRRDWAIRIALGLPGSRLIGQVMGHSALLITAGIGFGVVGAAVLNRLLSSFLYGVSALDPFAFVTAAITLLGIGLLAAFVPALRAARVDPLVALRYE